MTPYQNGENAPLGNPYWPASMPELPPHTKSFDAVKVILVGLAHPPRVRAGLAHTKILMSISVCVSRLRRPGLANYAL